MQLETPSLLITDDDRAFRETLRGVFEPRGFHTLLAGDGEEAVSIVMQEPVHLLVMDMHMPRLTGLEAIRRVKQIDRQLPCILVSARMDDALAEEARQAQVFSVLAKPFSYRTLTGMVRQALKEAYDWPESDEPGT